MVWTRLKRDTGGEECYLIDNPVSQPQPPEGSPKTWTLTARTVRAKRQGVRTTKERRSLALHSGC